MTRNKQTDRRGKGRERRQVPGKTPVRPISFQVVEVKSGRVDERSSRREEYLGSYWLLMSYWWREILCVSGLVYIVGSWLLKSCICCFCSTLYFFTSIDYTCLYYRLSECLLSLKRQYWLVWRSSLLLSSSPSLVWFGLVWLLDLVLDFTLVVGLRGM